MDLKTCLVALTKHLLTKPLLTKPLLTKPLLTKSLLSPAPSGGGAMDLGAWVTKAFAELPSSPETGLSVADISRYCSNMTGRDIAKSAISSICDNMSIQGHIYSTIDEEHFAKI
jgi:hypothetical protein